MKKPKGEILSGKTEKDGVHKAHPVRKEENFV